MNQANEELLMSMVKELHDDLEDRRRARQAEIDEQRRLESPVYVAAAKAERRRERDEMWAHARSQQQSRPRRWSWISWLWRWRFE